MSCARVVSACLVAAAAVATAACGNGRTTDQELGPLVVKPDDTIKPIDVAKAARDPGELGRAIALPHREVERVLGPHVTTFRSATVVTEGANQVDALTVDTTIELGDAGAWHAVSNNSADYGRETIYLGGALYLRPRYARWHKRAPNDKHEAAAIRDDYAAELAAVWDLFAPGVELTDRGNRTVAGRAGRVVEIKLSPSPKKPPAETLTQRKWRETRIVEAAAGEIVIDAESGVPLAAKLAGKIAYVRDGRKFQWTIEVSEDVRDIGTAVAIAAPDPAEVVATPERRREVEDRNALLDGIAPPIGAKAADGAGAEGASAGAQAGSGSGSGSGK